MSLSVTMEQIKAFKPCRNSFLRVSAALKKLDASKDRAFTAADARSAGCTHDDIIWIASCVAMNDEDVIRRLTGYRNDNAKRVLHIFEEAAPDDPRVRACIQATDDFLAGRIDEASWEKAAWAARAARAWDAEFHAWQFNKLIEWLSPEAPEPLPMPARVQADAA